MERILGGLPMTQPLSDIPPVEEPILGGDVRSIFRPDETKLDKAKGLADAGLSLFGALVHGVPAQFMGKMGPEFQAKRFRPPQTPAGERYFDVAAEALGKVAEAFPMQPTAFTSPANILAGPAVAQAGAKAADVNAMAQRALQAAGGRLEKAVEKQVYSTMEKGGLPAEILQGMTQGTQSFMVPQRVEAPRNEMKLYSPAEEAALNLQRGQGRGEGFLSDLRKAGVKDEELEYTGLKDFLAGKQNVSKKEIQDYLAENKVQLGEVQLGHRTRSYEGLTNQIDELQNKIISAQEDFQNSGYLFREIRDDKMLNELPFDWQLKYDKIVNMKEMLEKLENQRYDLPKGEPTRHSQWTLPGGENYREILLTLPSDSMTTDQIAQKLFGKQMRFLSEAEKDEVVQESRRLFENRTDYRSSHWDQPNVLAHLRVNDRVDADGKKMLLIEEIQSDWHQAGREKGYASKSGQLPAGWEVVEVPKYGYRGGPQIGTEFMVFDRSKTQVGFASPTREGAIANATGSSSLGVPDAPFKEDWYQLVLKRALQEAVDKGYDRVGITTGKRQIDRYTDALRANVDAIEYEPFKTDAGEIRYEVVGVKNGKPVVELDDLSYKDLQKKVGKEIAEKIRANAGESLAADRPMRPDWMRLSADNLSIGGEGMKKYYDEIYPGFLNKYGKKFDAKVGDTALQTKGEWPFPIEIASDGKQYWLRSKDPSRSDAATVDVSKRFDSYGDADKARDKLYAGFDEPVRYIDITPKMKEALSKGQPMFKEGGLVSNTDTIKARLIEQGMPEDKAFMQALKLANEKQMADGESPDLQEAATMMTLPQDAKNIPLSTFGKMLLDIPAGLGKGAVQGTIGLPGDVISVTRGVGSAISPDPEESRIDAFLRGMKKRTVLPTTEDVRRFFDQGLNIPLVPVSETDEIRRQSANISETIGELFGGGKTAMDIGKAVARTNVPANISRNIDVPRQLNEPLAVEEPLAVNARSGALPGQQRITSAKSEPAIDDGAGAVESVQFVKLPDGRFATSTAFQQARNVAVGFDQASTPEQAAHITAGLRKSPQEQLVAVVLDENDRPIQIIRHTIGLASQTSAEPFSLLGAIANTPKAKSFWISHNHPSGNPELSSADRNLANAINNISRGTGIEMRGILAIGKSKFAAYSPDGTIDIANNNIPAAARTKSIDMVERTFRKANLLDSTKVESPTQAKDIAQKIAGDETGLVLFNAARQPVAFIPLTNINVGTLRQTGVAKQLLGSLERANATATMYVSKSKPNMAELSNLERMLQQAGSPMFDALVGANRESLLMTDALPRQSMDFRSVFPITGAAMAGLGDDTTNPELSKAKGGLAAMNRK
jgi:hypothetical protein